MVRSAPRRESGQRACLFEESDIPTQSLNAAALRRVKIGVTAAFVAHAALFSSWAAHIPHVKAALGLTDGALGTALFGAPLGSVAATLFSHWALPRWGSRRLVPVMLVGYALSPMTVGLATSGWWLFLTLMLWGWFQGPLDVAMNTQAATVERLALIGHLAQWAGLTAALVTIPVVISIAALAIAATSAFDAADEFHRP